MPGKNRHARTSRRHFLIVLAGCGMPALLHSDESRDNHSSALPGFDCEIERFMLARGIPGGALAVLKDRRLVYARGYGWADRKGRLPVKPDSLFRIASLSKPITALATLKLVQCRLLSLDTQILDLIHPFPPANKITHSSHCNPPSPPYPVRANYSADPIPQTYPLNPVNPVPSAHPVHPVLPSDPRWREITVLHLLQHTGGWDRDQGFDPMFRPRQIARAMGVCCPPAPRAIIDFMLERPLDFDPGTRYAYSNFGYCLLGRVIEAFGVMPYEQFVRQKILSRIGIESMRIGASLEVNRAPNEVRYYTADDGMAPSVFSPGDQSDAASAAVPEPYGSFCLESMDSHGGWLASVLDLARLTAALDDPSGGALLDPGLLAAMYARPPSPLWRNTDGSLKDFYYACGWLVRPMGKAGRANYWHNGSLPGTYALWVRRRDGLSWVVLFNQRSGDPKLPDSEIDPALHRAAAQVRHWPCADLFGR
ncbi:MAG: beta-lactamase family protein [Candidatus Omnitrophica bacterium]|nr:beta-lactamase family protein [Candidatus Omnitrophota bacterium]